MKHAIISSVNIAEVYKHCVAIQNLTKDGCRNLIKLSGVKIIDFCEEQALITAIEIYTLSCTVPKKLLIIIITLCYSKHGHQHLPITLLLLIN